MIWNAEDVEICKDMVSEWLSFEPVESNPNGLDKMWQNVSKHFADAGFELKIIENKEATYRPLLIASLENSKGNPWIGFFGHYDVEPADSDKWSTNPWELHEEQERWYGRGVADNLVPLAQRIIMLSRFPTTVNIVYVLQGEEEIGSPFALENYPELELPRVKLWIEETGYFYKDGRQRLMVLNRDSFLNSIINSLKSMANHYNRSIVIRERALNKAFGAENCPCLKHLVKDTPYIAVGPNDDHSKVHGSDESISLNHLELIAKQYMKIAEVVSNG